MKVRADQGSAFESTRSILRQKGVRTVCDSAHCPNISECWKDRAATFMLLGGNCTRHCRFCAVGHGRPDQVDDTEPLRVSEAVKDLGLRYAVITSVTRDDLADMGAAQFAHTTSAIKRDNGTKVELLIPDMRGDRRPLETILDAHPDVIGHNLETVRRLQPAVRDRNASYEVSLRALRLLKAISPATLTKTSLLLGLGEEPEEVLEAMQDAFIHNVDILVLGQYLRPRGVELPVHRYLPPEEFHELAIEARKIGFRSVVSAPLARTSYRAEAAYRETIGDEDAS
jgi:lipoic acid synthetase